MGNSGHEIRLQPCHGDFARDRTCHENAAGKREEDYQRECCQKNRSLAGKTPSPCLSTGWDRIDGPVQGSERGRANRSYGRSHIEIAQNPMALEVFENNRWKICALPD